MLVRELRSHMLHSQKNQSLKNRNNIVRSFKKTLKMVHIKTEKKNLKKEAKRKGEEEGRKEKERHCIN